MMKKLSLLLLWMPALLWADTAEIKMLISPAKLQDAKKTLDIKPGGKPEVRVCFFDTKEAALDEKKVIIRARLQKVPNKKGERDLDSVIKLRGNLTAPAGFSDLKSEADWVGADASKDVKPSFSLKQEGLDEDKLRSVLDGTLNVRELLSTSQQEFAAACLGVVPGQFPWTDLKRYGVIEVWKSKRPIGKLKDVAVELWRLTADGKEELELLEISIKTKKDDQRPVPEIAAEFYSEAEGAGLGNATGESKTQKVIEYYKPGK